MVNNKAMRGRILQVSKDTGIPAKKVLDFLFYLHVGDPIENNDLLQRLGVSKNALNQAKERLSSLLEQPSKTTQLKSDAVEEVRGLFGSDYKTEEVLWAFLEDENYKKTLELLKKHEDKRLSPERKYDQFTATVETTARRTSLLNQS